MSASFCIWCKNQYKSDTINIADILVTVLVSLVMFSDICWHIHKIQQFNARSSCEKRFYSQVKFIIIDNNYDRSMVLYLAFNYYGSSEVITEIQCYIYLTRTLYLYKNCPQ